MTFNDKKQIILSYIDADIAGTIPDIPAYVQGVGQSPNIKAHADDTFRIIAQNFGKPNKQELVNALLSQLNRLMSFHLE